jgi:methionyl-tRNA synthetase
VTYVWFDALINYISALGYPDGELFHKYWPHVQHVVAKDILKPHGIYWPIILKAAGIRLYNHLNVHGYWNVDQSKMSKSIGNVVDPLQMKDIYGLDAFRFFLMRDMVFGLDSNLNEFALVERINSDLANDFGNLVSRVLAMTHKYFSGVIPKIDLKLEEELKIGLSDDAARSVTGFTEAMENFEFHKAILSVWDFVGRMNKYVDVTAPWELAKKKASKPELEAVMYNLLEGIRILSGLVYPFMPDTAKKIQKFLGLDPESKFYAMDQLKQWNVLLPGTQVQKSTSLFPRIDPEKIHALMPPSQKESGGDAPEFKPPIDIETLDRIDLRVATVLSAEKIPKAKKLLKLEVDIGEKRTVVAGIAESYEPEDLVGKQVIIVANLKPAKLMGILSNGMVLAATDDKSLALTTVMKPVKPGTRLR